MGSFRNWNGRCISPSGGHAGSDFPEEQQTFLCVSSTGTFITEGQRAAPYFRFLSLRKRSTARTFSGVSACPGAASGRVRIVRSHDHIQQFRKGEILVANQTTPEFVPA